MRKYDKNILIEFLSYLKRKEILLAKKELKGTKIYVNENLTKSRYILLKRYGRQAAWSYGGRIYLKVNGQINKINSMEDAD